MNYPLKLIAIKVDFNFDFKKYLYLFDKDTQLKILSYKFQQHQVIAFTSEMLKYYYLANELQLEPKHMQIACTQYGRPFLVDNPNNLSFNISHSSEYVVMAVAYNSTVGVDIEYINNDIVPVELSSLVFSKSEQSLVDNDIEKFYILWTKKEALMKARGTGFIGNDYIETNLTLDADNLHGYLIYADRIFDEYHISIAIG